LTAKKKFHNTLGFRKPPSQKVLLPPLKPDFIIDVEVPLLGTKRSLRSEELHRKINDLLERGLILHDTAKVAISMAKNHFRDKS